MNINRRKLLASVAALAPVGLFAACSAQQAQTTIANIVAAIQTGCNFVISSESAIAVVVSYVSSFNAAAGAAAQVAEAIGTEVVNAVCGAVMASTAAATSKEALARGAATPGQQITVIVNGVPVTGVITGPAQVRHK